jgi:hypothetical protein
MLDLVGVEHGPADSLDQLARVVVGLEVCEGDPLSIHDRVWGLLGGVGHYEYLGHGASFVG